MKYYKTQIEIRAIEEGQEFLIESDWIEVTLEEVEAVNKAKEEEFKNSIEYIISEAKSYLSSTDFYMTVDKYAELSEERKVELTTKRAEARELINELEVQLEVTNG